MTLNDYFLRWPRGKLRTAERKRIARALGVSLESVKCWEYPAAKKARRPRIELLPKLVKLTGGLCAAHELNPRCAPLMKAAAASARVGAVPIR